MEKTLPKGHVSCLSGKFKYTPALSTSVAKTFARIRAEQKPQRDQRSENIRVLAQRKRG
jgi:hypothetical protein